MPGIVMSAESAASRASQIARQLLLFGRPIPKDELVERLSALTIERLTDLSARLFSSKPTVTAVGPVGTLAPYEAIRDALAATQLRRPQACGLNTPRPRMFSLPFFRRASPALKGER